MSWDQYEDNCPGCRPCLVDMKTRRPLPDAHPSMRTAMRVWEQTTRAERAAFHRVMCQQSQHWFDVGTVQRIQQRIKQAMRDKVLS